MAILDTFKKEKSESGSGNKTSARTSSAKGAAGKKNDTAKLDQKQVIASRKRVNTHDVLRRPHVTEKATMLAETNTYVFEADARVGKTEIRKAIVELYDVHPLKVNITNVPAKTIISKKGVKGVRPGKKKAIVYLKKGDKIDTL